MIGPFLAIVGDTWRQSKHQVVMLVFIGLLGIAAPVVGLVVETRPGPDGNPLLLATWEPENQIHGIERGWEGLYADSLKREIGLTDEINLTRKQLEAAIKAVNDADFYLKGLEARNAPPALIAEARASHAEAQKVMEAANEVNRDVMRREREAVDARIAERTGHISKVQKGVEAWLGGAATLLFTIAMFGVIVGCAGFVPAMLEGGSVDLVLSKPIRRWHLYFGKYIGALILYSLALFGAYVIIFVLLGARTGVWHWRFFVSLPMTVFSMALLNAIVGWVGLWTRSTGLAIVIGLVYYLIVDTAVGAMTDPAMRIILGEIQGLRSLAEVVETTFPSFVGLRKSAEAAVYSIDFWPKKHILVGFAWLAICLGTAYNRFRINDY